MKRDLSRPQKIALIQRLAQECEAKQQQRIPLDPRPRAPPPNRDNRLLGSILGSKARSILNSTLCTHHGEVDENSSVFKDRLCEVIALATRSIEADATRAEPVITRGLAKLRLSRFDEGIEDAIWAEQIIREGPQPLDETTKTSLVMAIYYAACGYLQTGREEDAHRDLHAADATMRSLGLKVDSLSSLIADKLEFVHEKLDDYKLRFSGDTKAEQLERIAKWNGYGLSVYELALLNEAGVPPWCGTVKHILKVVDDIKIDGPSQKSREHHETTQCHNCWTSKSEVKLFLCAKCKSAKYCSKECQKAAWPEHKVHCKVAAASREKIDSSTEEIRPFGHVPDLPTSPNELASMLQGWTNKHRPLLARCLVNALDLRRDPKAHVTNALFIMVDWVSLDKPTAQRFKVVSAAVQEFSSIPGGAGDGIADTRQNLDGVQRKKGGYGVAMMIIMCVSCTPPALNVAPVYLHKGVTKEPVESRWLDILTAKLG